MIVPGFVLYYFFLQHMRLVLLFHSAVCNPIPFLVLWPVFDLYTNVAQLQLWVWKIIDCLQKTVLANVCFPIWNSSPDIHILCFVLRKICSDTYLGEDLSVYS